MSYSTQIEKGSIILLTLSINSPTCVSSFQYVNEVYCRVLHLLQSKDPIYDNHITVGNIL